MSVYVVDASIVAQQLITDTFTEHTHALFRLLDTGADELWIPEVCLLECANVLWKEVRFREMPPDQATQLIHDLAALPLRVVPVSDLLPRTLTIAVTHQITVYDAVFIALAERLGCPLITADARQESMARAIGVGIKPITDFKAGGGAGD